MTKNEAIAIVKEMNLSSNDTQEIIDIIIDVSFESFMCGFEYGYDKSLRDCQ